MNIHHVLLFCFLSALCGGNSGLVSAKPPIFTGPEGGHGTISCHLNVSGSRKFFCREECKEEDILIRTDKFSAKSGRYSIRYKNKGSSGGSILSVTITNLTQSDSGQYRCGLGTSAVPDLFEDFEVRISDALVDRNSGFFLTNVEGDKVQFSCRDAVNSSRMFLCRGECKKQEDILIETDKNKDQSGRYTIEYKEGSAFGQYVTITQVVKSDSGRYRCGYGRALSPDSYHMFLLLVDTSTPTTTHSLSSSSGNSKPSPVFLEPTNQPTAAAPTTSKPIRTLQPFSTSVPSASTPTTTPTPTTAQSLSSSSGRSTTSPVFPETSNQPSAAVLSASTPTTIQSLSSSSGTSTPSPVFPETTNQPTAAAPTTSKPIRTLQPFSTSVPSASTPTTTQSLSSSSGRSTPSPVFPETSNQPSAAAPTTSKPIRTLQPFSTSVPSASTPTTTQSLSSSSGRSTPSPVFPETFNQPSAAAPTTSKPIRTLQPFSTSVPSASTPTTTQSLSSSSGRSTPSPVFPETSNQPSVAAFSDAPHPTSSYVPSYLLPLVVCVLLLGLLLLVGFLLLLYIQKTRKNKEPKH